MIIEGYSKVHALFFFICLLMVLRTQMFFSLKPSVSQGESSLKIPAGVCRFGGVREQTYKQTDRLTDIPLLLYIYYYCKKLRSAGRGK